MFFAGNRRGYTAFLHSIKLSGYKVKTKINKDPLAEEQNNDTTKIVNAYIVDDLDTWPNNPLRSFTLKSWLFCVTNIVKNNDKEKSVYNGYGKVFDGKCTCRFGSDYDRNVISFGFDNSLSCDADNYENNFLVLGKELKYGINGSFGSLEKKFRANFSKAKTKLCQSLDYNQDNSCLFVGGKEIFKFKAGNGSINFPTQVCLERISHRFCATESREVSLEGDEYDFSDDISVATKSDVLNIQNYLNMKSNIIKCLGLLKKVLLGY